ncbi:transporter substrate-binding domain-containing protein [Ochrobactrum sp. MR28]|jgi:polar amino acid transport system substrate-binding protein|nr:transporter substrate-binding domain-containing protein [Ochrobactrum sp. MR28]MBX8816361.1 transporter substrate-binding domain-containing protein [Ochrobactrum sp. MR31]MDR2310216.1 transporter substrate-binding domain-containing protein [Brucellaceae bacterium]
MSVKKLALYGMLTAFSAISFMPFQPNVAQAETLRVGMECTYAPFNYRLPTGEMAGYDVDVAKGVAELIGADLEYVCQQFDGMIPALLANKFDLIIASLSITKERLEKIDFSIPYRVSIGRFLGPKGKNLNLFDEAGNVIPDNFKGLKVGVERATTYNKWIEAELPDANIQLYDSGQAMLLDLRSGRVDIAITNPMKAYLDFLSQENGSGFEFVSPVIDKKEYFGEGVGIGAQKGSEELMARVNKALATLIKNGDLEKFSHKYFPFNINPENWQGIEAN